MPPQISVHEIDQSNDDFVILASDGLWDHVTNLEAVEIVRKAAYSDKHPESASDCLVQVRACVIWSSPLPLLFVFGPWDGRTGVSFVVDKKLLADASDVTGKSNLMVSSSGAFFVCDGVLLSSDEQEPCDVLA